LREAKTVTQNDPTDTALATIASMLDHPEPPHRGSEKALADNAAGSERSAADGYYKMGPGPMAAIRFKWMVRRADNGEYYVDETIGDDSMPMASGPMSGDAAVKLVDDRESEARRRFEALRNEMAGRGAVANLVRTEGEA
jgi:hypothetical protein